MPGHVSIRVSALEKSVQFYLAALGPLSYTEMRFPTVVGLGLASSASPIPDFWLRQYKPGPENGFADKPTPVHISFHVGERRLVDEFHAAGIQAGGLDNGPPGERPWFDGYYVASLQLRTFWT
ncbi:glyoxalase/bleomycin resistance protein/dioxygenase [Fusarium proliferatum]|uniref:Glyoxalase/bleomycin resistance protein/dioxygenase n=1 Tax=Gibberella intermedia TaxID=948311 RepID=A0A365N588_GIBIN|nr:glyoxalase/bleomycin resistance protein/dioxygenase [Fusarium proliferatum]